VGEIYRCKVKNNPNIIAEESTDISGVHQSSKSNDDVLGIYAAFKTIQIFPKGLEFVFKNLKVIWIESCELREIHQSDLMFLPKLVHLTLIRNEIEVIEEGLFDFNPNLKLVWLYEAKIIHIDPNVFDHLNELSDLNLEPVPCVGQNIWNSRPKVIEAIKVIKSNCSNSQYLSLQRQIKNLEIEAKSLNSKAFNIKLSQKFCKRC